MKNTGMSCDAATFIESNHEVYHDIEIERRQQFNYSTGSRRSGQFSHFRDNLFIITIIPTYSMMITDKLDS